jgi:hypothetical protein
MNNVRAFEAFSLQELFNGFLGPNLMLIFLSNQGYKHSQLLHECNSQNGGAFGSHWASSLAFSPICESVFHS